MVELCYHSSQLVGNWDRSLGSGTQMASRLAQVCVCACMRACVVCECLLLNNMILCSPFSMLLLAVLLVASCLSTHATQTLVYG